MVEEELQELRLLMGQIVATTGMRPRPRPGQTWEMAMIERGLEACRGEAPKTKCKKKPVKSVGLPAMMTGAISGRRWISEKKVEAEFGFPAKTLRNKRSLGEGPPFRKFKRAVLYQIAAVEQWIEQQPQGGDGVPTSALKRS